ncbi:MAG: GDSL-type esterase/lipase family protein [Cyclobacteriaceae bacterium]|jgi:lysophospholipase L1-like esterase|nr:GDSL-type esterase/lipase family protein [Cyclobacteriaceae bacterium]
MNLNNVPHHVVGVLNAFWAVIWMSVFFTSTPLAAQDTIPVPKSAGYTFLPDEDNVIQNAPVLSPFFEKLYQLTKGGQHKVNVVHIGDSHIQADFLTASVRERLQHAFGNGGRGVVFPGRVARTNEPPSIYSSSKSLWDTKRIVFTETSLPIGIYPLTLQTQQPQASLQLKVHNGDKMDYRFDRVTLFFKKDVSSFNVVVKDSIGQDLGFAGPYTFEQTNTSTLYLPYAVRQVELQAMQANPGQRQFTLFGLNLENSRPGIVYHALGGNGAKFKHYLAATNFAEQTAAVQPDLFVISLGTNEAIEYPYVDPQLTQHLDAFIQRLKHVNPNAFFLITTPPDAFKRKTRRNPGIEVVRNRLIDYAAKNQLAWWDLYAAGGGKHNADAWRKAGLMQSDGIHFTRAGYDLQGQLLFQALIKAYNDYVLYRYP